MVSAKQIVLAIFLLQTVFQSGCSRFYYVPNSQHVPLFREKNDFRLGAAIGSGTETTSLELQAAHAVTNHIALMTSYFNAWSTPNDTSEGARGHHLELGGGYFTKIKERGSFEVYGGFGGGKQHHEYLGGGKADLAFNRFFLQTSIGYATPYFDVAISGRLASYTITKIDNNIEPGLDYDELEMVRRNNNSILLEPALTIRGGYKYLKVQTQLLFSQNLSHPQLPFDDGQFNIGLYFTIAQWYMDEFE